MKSLQKSLRHTGIDQDRAAALSFEKLILMVLNQDALQQELDELQQTLMPIFNSSIVCDLSLLQAAEKPIMPFRQKLLETMATLYLHTPQHGAALANALHYQDLIAANLLQVAQPITLESTGVVGLKYGHTKSSLTGNPHPLKRLPMFVSSADGKIIQLYTLQRTLLGRETNYLSFGRLKHFLTTAGIDLIERLSQQRGS